MSRKRTAPPGGRDASGAEDDPAGRSLIYGFHATLEALDRGQVAFEKVILARGRADARGSRIHRLARERGIPVQFTPPRALDRLAGGMAHQGIVGVISAREYASLEDVLSRGVARGLLVLVDGVQDPRNLGAIIRTAGAAGAGGVVISSRGSCGLTGVVAKTAAGALESVPVARKPNLASVIPLLKERGFWVIGLDPMGDCLWTDADFTAPTALVLGGEEGLGVLVRRRCDRIVRLPVRPPVESLNVSVAAGVALYEVLRQRGANLDMGVYPGAGREGS